MKVLSGFGVKILQLEEKVVVAGVKNYPLFPGLYIKHESDWYRISFKDKWLSQLCSCKIHRGVGEYLDNLLKGE